ncbi:MazG-like nucleotide pyrophosphohydrolase family protein [Kribbella orskensis]|uniref:MazG-like nucleotide pyrophosphohydrolase family protein n=1 Tax=Kribbella orskensis TaxID=2512216 RepID=A0ABY2BPA7_9ACTN|nr:MULTISPECIES: nucleotide pyrophosphohydrolase [Kribbella]TCN39808.1 MazG-like nucleotide pyrophosphohydrolase family protein [Kribbella sp. VKM Ac-2500]TCO27409.1 MazG-like nucleotide pyrophosphohydrolase family protein [Kribbella orskensis]
MQEGLETLRQELAEFAAERDWEQFHTPKNLAMALAGEVGELAAELQWLTDEEIRQGLATGVLRQRVAGEVADVFIYLLRLADVCGIELLSAAHAKVVENRVRYPVEKARGNARKYDELADEE